MIHLLKCYKCGKENLYLQRQTVTTVYLWKMTKRTLCTTTTTTTTTSSSSTASNNMRGLRTCLSQLHFMKTEMPL